MKKVFIIIIIMFSLVGCSDKKEVKTDAVKFMEEYEALNNEKTNYGDYYYRSLDIDSDNPIIYKSAEEVIEMIDNKDSFAIYFGFPDCPWCRSVIETMLDVSNDLDIDNIYYVNIKDIRNVLKVEDSEIVTSKEGTKEYYLLLDKLSNVLEDYTLTDNEGNEINTNTKRIYAPNIVAIVDGVATKMTTGISDKQTDAYMELNDEIRQESYDMIKCTLECLNEEKTVCTMDKKC